MQHPRLRAIQERFLSYHRASNHSAKQLTHYRLTFRDFARFLEQTDRPNALAVLTSATCEAFVAWLRETPLERTYRGTNRRTLSGIWGHMKDLRAFVHWCQEEEVIDWRVKVPLPKLPKRLFPILSDAELVALFQSPDLVGKSEFAVRNRALLAILLDTGVRLGELAGLTPRSIQGSYLRVIGKGDKERIVPFQPPAGRLLAEWLKVRAQLPIGEDEPLFRLGYHGIVSLIRRLKRDTGIDIFAHKLRHTAATKMVIARVDLHSVKEMLGHTQITTTEGYLTMAKEDLRAKHAEGSPFASIAARLPDEHPTRPTRLLLRVVSEGRTRCRLWTCGE